MSGRFTTSVVLLALCLPQLAAAQPAPERQAGGAPPRPQELKKSVEERLSDALGSPVRISQLRYELLTSRFVGGGIEVGARGAPLLQVSDVEVKLALLSGEGGVKVERVSVRGVRLRLSGSLPLDQPLRWPPRSFELRQGVIRDATFLLGEQELTLEGVALSLEQVELQIDDRGGLRAISGRFALSAEKLLSSGKELGRLELVGSLKGKAMLIEKASLTGAYGSLQLSGKVGLGGKLLGPWRLAGTADLNPRPGIQLKGGVQLRGASLGKLTAQLALRAQRGLPPKLRLEELPPLKVRGTLGGKQLQGTLRDLRMR